MRLRSLGKLWRRLRRRRAFKHVVFVESMTSLPDRLASDIYVVRRAGFDRRAAFECPCTCGRRIDLNLVRSQEPHWSITVRDGKVSIHPSVWLAASPCGSHFFVRDSKVTWV
jgi:hypothetical protein